jgi:hypothetical protein
MRYTSCVIVIAGKSRNVLPESRTAIHCIHPIHSKSQAESHGFDWSDGLFETDGQDTAVRLKRWIRRSIPVSSEIRLEPRNAVCPTPLAVRAPHIDRGASIKAIIYKTIWTYDPQVETTVYVRNYIPNRSCSPRDLSRLPCYARAAIASSQDRYLACATYLAVPDLSTSSISLLSDIFTLNRLPRSA